MSEKPETKESSEKEAPAKETKEKKKKSNSNLKNNGMAFQPIFRRKINLSAN